MKHIIAFVLLAICVAGTFSEILEEQHKEKLRQIRNTCAVESGVTSYDISIAKRAIGPAKKLVKTSHCVVKTLSEQRDDRIVKEIIERAQVAIQNSDFSKVLARLKSECQNLVGQEVCSKAVEIASVVIENIRAIAERRA